MSPPPGTRCPSCYYLPASATVICPQCSHDRREIRFEAQCPYTRKACNCDLRSYCVLREPW